MDITNQITCVGDCLAEVEASEALVRGEESRRKMAVVMATGERGDVSGMDAWLTRGLTQRMDM